MRFFDQELVFCPYLLLGYPDTQEFFALVEVLIAQGAKVFELWIPFSDPMADGPVLTEANSHMIAQGCSFQDSLDLLVEFRQRYPDVGIVIMSYVNPIFYYGFDRFFEFMQQQSIDGFLLPDVPLQEYEVLNIPSSINNVMIVSDNLSDANIKKISEQTSWYLYVLSSISTTGQDVDYKANLSQFVSRLRALVGQEKKLVVWFGIKNAADVDFLKTLDVDGFIIGSEIVKKYTEGGVAAVASLLSN